MERFLITVDCGTTNTRAVLWNRDGTILETAKDETGVRNTAIDGNNAKLGNAVRGCVESLLARRGLSREDIVAVYASGMITSNVGLVEIPHLVAPATREDFIKGVKSVRLPDVWPDPINFIPGLKNLGGGIAEDNVEAMDIMRGEETEVIALLDWFENGREYLFVLPGSHTKFITLDAGGRMTGCLTSLAGEILSALTNHTILADAVGRNFVGADSYRPRHMLAGYRTARETSLARAAFSTRIMNQFVTGDALDCANFLLGAVLQNDVAAVKTSKALTVSPRTRVVVAGKEPLRTALVDAFRHDGSFENAEAFSPPDGIVLSGYGAYLVARSREEW